jgi:sterol desaturase/sphingolipid hydroxylase (fatty acid hydroxylase superfamily)
MSLLRAAARYAYAPMMLVGANGVALYITAGNAPVLIVAALAPVALAFTFLIERVLPYEPLWNKSHGDQAKDVIHGVVFEISNLYGILLLPVLTWLMPWHSFWPFQWPLWCQFIVAIVVTDFITTSIHYFSHRVGWLWRLHSVHHGVNRLYGFNGLVRHPLHQQIDLALGTLPLVLAGMPINIAVLLGLATTLQLIVQHSNVDFRIGPFQHLLAIGSVHRLHHVNWANEGDVNFGLFFTFWDRVFGTYRAISERAPAATDIGLQDRPAFPQRYLAQLAVPFVAARLTTHDS